MLPISLEAVLQLVELSKNSLSGLKIFKLSFLVQNCYGIHSHTPKEGHHKLND